MADKEMIVSTAREKQRVSNLEILKDYWLIPLQKFKDRMDSKMYSKFAVKNISILLVYQFGLN